MTDAVQIWAQRFGIPEEEAARHFEEARARADHRARSLAKLFGSAAAARPRHRKRPGPSDFEIMLHWEDRRLASGLPVTSVVVTSVVVLAMVVSMVALTLM